MVKEFVSKPWTFKLKDVALIVSAIAAGFVVISRVGQLYVEQRINEEQSAAIRNIEGRIGEIEAQLRKHEIEQSRYYERIERNTGIIERCCRRNARD